VVTHPLKDFLVRFKPGEIVYQEGDPGSEMFIVQSGSVRIFRHLGGTKQVLAVMEKGDFFGEMSVLEGSPRTASAEAAEPSELIEINTTIFDRMIRGNIEIAVRMLRKLSGRLQESQRRLDEAVLSAGSAPVARVDLDRPPEEPAPIPAAREVPPPEPAKGEPRPGSRIDPAWIAALFLEEGDQVFPIRTEQSIIGRYDPVTGVRPEIDLTRIDTNRSVSRRHARVIARDGGVFVAEEVGALNGTFLNGRRLAPGKPEPIRTGDVLALGMVRLRFEGKEGGAPGDGAGS
jgi:hypothetical protein